MFIGYQQLFAYVVNAIIEMDSVTASATLDRMAGSAGYMSALLGSVLAALGIYLIIRTTQAFPGKSIVEFAPKLIGKFPGIILSSFYCLFWIAQSTKTLREMVGLTSSYLLPVTPEIFIVLSAMAVVIYLCLYDLKVIGRVMELLVPITIIPGLILMSLCFSGADPTNLLPFFGNGLISIIKGGLLFGGTMQGVELLLVLMAYADKPLKAVAPGIAAMAVIMLFSSLDIMAVTAQFGAEEASVLVYPLARTVKLVTLPGSGILFVVVWWIAAYTTISLNYFVLTVTMSKLFRDRIDRRVFTLILLPFIILGTTMGTEIQFANLLTKFNSISIIFTLILPTLLYVVLRLRRFKSGCAD